MKFVCERCHTKYSIADEKVRGKVLKVRCKTCTNVITVRETGASIDDPANAGPREAPVSLSGSLDGGRGANGSGQPASLAAHVAHSLQGGAAATKARPATAHLPAAALVAPGAPAAAPPPRRLTPPAPLGEKADWYLAVDGAQTGPFTRSRLVDKVLAANREADLHVWKEDFDGWKPPREVAELAAEITRRQRSKTPVPPPPLRRPTGPAAPLAARPAAPAGLGGGLATIEPTTVDLPKHHIDPASGHAHPVAHAHGHGPAVDHGHQKRNGVASAGAVAHAEAVPTDFGIGDLLGLTNATGLPAPSPAAALPAPAVTRRTPAEAPLVMVPPASAVPRPAIGPAESFGARIGAKAKPVKLILGAVAVVVVLCGIVVVSMFKRPAKNATASANAAATASARAQGTDFAGLTEKLAREEATATAPKPEVAPPTVEPAPTAARIEPPVKTGKGKKRKTTSTTPPPIGNVTLTAEQREAANRFGDANGREVRVPTATASSAHATPAQADISRVINNNRQGIQTCYQRALLRDSTLTHGKVTVRVSIGLSGKVKSVSLDAPAQFRALEPCIREVMSRWAFPPSSEEYGTEFPVVLQGNQ